MERITKPVFKRPPPDGHPFRFKPDKALEALLYLADRMPSNKRSRYFLNKLFFYADKRHLELYSRFIAGDYYVAMNEGPVPSNVYNMLKEISGDEDHEFNLNYEGCFRVTKKNVVFYDPERKPNTDLLSESDLECLDFAIEHYAPLSKTDLGQISHDEPSYKIVVKESGLNMPMEITHFVQFLDGGNDLASLLTGE